MSSSTCLSDVSNARANRGFFLANSTSRATALRYLGNFPSLAMSPIGMMLTAEIAAPSKSPRNSETTALAASAAGFTNPAKSNPNCTMSSLKSTGTSSSSLPNSVRFSVSRNRFLLMVIPTNQSFRAT